MGRGIRHQEPCLPPSHFHIRGYRVSKGTLLFVNLWKLQRDPIMWPDPNMFCLERFPTSYAKVDFTGQHHGFTLFGSGRRSCSGMGLATQVVHIWRWLVCFKGLTSKRRRVGSVDMSEGFGITLPKATPLQLMISPRLHDVLYQNWEPTL